MEEKEFRIGMNFSGSKKSIAIARKKFGEAGAFACENIIVFRKKIYGYSKYEEWQ